MAETWCIVGCGDKKQDTDQYTPAGELYTSTYFQLKREFAEQHSDDWWILSAEHGLLEPQEKIKPYDTHIDDLSDLEVDSLKRRLYLILSGRLYEKDTLILLTGKQYTELIKGDFYPQSISELSFQIHAPFQHHDLQGIGEQMHWLKQHIDSKFQYQAPEQGQQSLLQEAAPR